MVMILFIWIFLHPTWEYVQELNTNNFQTHVRACNCIACMIVYPIHHFMSTKTESYMSSI